MSVVPSHLWANPVGEQVVAGAATFQRVGNSLTIQQGTDRAVINWNQFSIGAGETTKFVMPNASSAALNRVLSGNPSAIYGNLQANGHLFLINPAGVLVGPGGTIQAGSFIASTRDVATETFMRGGDLSFLGESGASILNQGKIEAQSGDVFLIAQHVENEGQLMAKDGTVGMVSGTQVSLQSVGPHHFKVRLMDIPDEAKVKKDADGTADLVNDGVIEAANAVLEATGNVGSLAINNRGTIRATGVKANADGSVTLTGGEGDVLNSGVIAALRKNMNGEETGGQIQIAGRNITAEASSLVTAAGAAGGGEIQMRATDTTLISGRVEATGYADQAKGGRVELLGRNVGLRSGEVNADGGAKGGTVLLGGDYLGLNPKVPNAKATVMTPDARISANATVNGDGGKVILWSDEYTGFFGRITALGGPEGGNGGFIETSSKNNLQAFGEAQASAPKGISGEWLLDPFNVQIVDFGPTGGGRFDGRNPDLFTPTSAGATIFNQDINRALNSGTSVTITTGSSAIGSQDGNITVSANILKSQETPKDAPNVSLTLRAANDIVLENGVSISSARGTLGINLLANADATGGGNIDLQAGVILASNGGDIVLQATSLIAVVAGAVTIDATTLPAVANALYGGQRFSGDVTFRSAVAGTTLGVGAVAPTTMAISQDLVNTVTLLDPTAATTARAGTLYLGSRNGGQLTLGTITSPNGLSYNLRLVAGINGLVQEAGGSGMAVADAMAFLDSAGSIGTVANPILVQAKRLGIFTEGSAFHVDSSDVFDRLYIQTAGTTVTQSLTDSGGNLNYDVTEDTGNTTIGAVSGLSVDTGSLDFTYINTSTLTGAGNITIGTGGSMTPPAGITFTVGTGVRYGILAVQDPNGAGGVWGGAPGRVTLQCNGTLTLLTESTTYAPASGLTTLAFSGGVFSGGGDINITARDIDFSQVVNGEYATRPRYTQTFPLTPGANLNYALLGPQFGPALNTFFPTVNDSTGGFDFGNRGNGNAYSGTFGQISGSSGILNIGASPSALGPTKIIFTDPTINTVRGQMNLGVMETIAMESKAIQIGSATTGDIVFGSLPTIPNVQYTYTNGNLTIVVTTSYTARYFELPVPRALDGAFGQPYNPDTGYNGQARVAGGRVSIVSGTGEVIMSGNSDVNVGAFSVTAIDGVNLQGFQRNDAYMNRQADQTNLTKDGSQFDYFSGRIGRTYLDEQSSTGGTYLAHFSQDGWLVSDTTQVITGRAQMKTASDGTLGVIGVAVDPLFGASSNAGGYVWANTIDPATVRVIIGSPDLAGGVQAEGTLVLNADGIPEVSMTQVGSGYLKPPVVQILVTKTADNATQSGFQQAGAQVTVSGGAVTSITPVVDAIAGTTLGGSGYMDAPEVQVVGGGIALGSARAVLDEYGRVGVIAAIDPGLGYTSVPSVSLTGGGGSGATAIAVVNSRGQLTPFEVTFGGVNYQSTPTIIITDLTGQGTGAVARPIMSSQKNGSIVGILPVYGGSGYTATSNLRVEIIGGNPDQAATATAFVPTGSSSLTSFVLTNAGSGYTSAPSVVLTGGGIRPAQARAIVDSDPTSGNFGKVVSYVLADGGQGYKFAPTVVVGAGTAVGQFGEVGVRTDNVDLETGSGSITLRAYRQLDEFESLQVLRPLTIYSPVSTGDSGTAEGSASVSGSILLEATGQVSANYRGIVSTGDVTVAPGGATETAFSGDITINAQRVLASAGILAESYGASQGFPVQIGSAPRDASAGVFTFNGNGNFQTASPDEGTILVYAPAPGQLDALYGKALNPNLPIPAEKRVSNDLQVAGLSTRADFENPVRIDVGTPEGKLSFRTSVAAAATPVVVGGEVTFINRINDQRTYATAPTVIIRGGGVDAAEATGTVSNGRLTTLSLLSGGDGYAQIPVVTITGGGGTGAEAVAIVDYDPSSPTFKQVTGFVITNAGFGYTSKPTVTIGQPEGVGVNNSLTGPDEVLVTTGANGQITAAAVVPDGLATGRPGASATGAGLGYYFSPTVTIVDLGGQGTGAQATAVVNSAGQITGFQITSEGTGYLNPRFVLSNPVQVATASANLDANGQIVSFTVTDPGGGYASTPGIFVQAGQNTDPFNLDLDHAGFFADRFDFSDLGTDLIRAQVVGLGPFTNQRPVDVGTLTPGATSFVANDVLRFEADALVLGTRKFDDLGYGAGVITVSQRVQADTFLLDTLALAGTRQIRDLGGTTGLAFSSVVIDAGGQVTLTGSGNRFRNFAGRISGSGLSDEADFFVSSSLESVNSGGSWLQIRPVTIGEVLINAPEFSGHRFYQGIETQNGDITVLADDIELTQRRGYLDTTGGGRFSTTSSTVTLATLSPGGSVPVQIYYSTPPLATGGAGLTSVQVDSPGSGYTSVPIVSLIGGGSGGAATAQMVLGAISLPQGIPTGTFTTDPTVTISGGGGSGAAAEAIIDYRNTSPTFGQVIGFRIINQGSGYTSQPTITISGGGSSSTYTTTGTLTVRSVTITGGSGYTSTPAVVFSGGGTGATQATGTALGTVLGLTISNPSRPELELVRASSVRIGGNTALSIEVPSPDGTAPAFQIAASAGNITLSTDFRYNYGLLPYAPRTLVLSSQGNITTSTSQIPPSPVPTPSISRILMPNFSLISSGTVSLAGNHQVSNFSALLNSVNSSLSFTSLADSLTVADLAPLGGVSGITTASGGSITLSAANLIVPFLSPGSSGSIPVTVNSGGNISLTTSSPTGKIQVGVAPVFNPANYTSSVMVAAGDITLTANRIELGDDGTNAAPAADLVPPLLAANAISGTVTLAPLTAGTAITLGLKTPSDFDFTSAELSNIQANLLRIGSRTAGAITVNAPITLFQTVGSANRLRSTLSLVSNSTIGDSGPGSGISYAGNIVFYANGAIQFTGTENDFGTVAAFSNGNNITLSSAAFNLASSAPDALNPAVGIQAAGATVTLQPNAVGTAITLWGPGATKTGWGFTSDELNLVKAGILRIGSADANTASVTVAGQVTLSTANLTSALTLRSGGDIGDQGGSTGISYAGGLALLADGNISFSGSFNQIGTVAANSLGNIVLTSGVQNQFSIGTVDGLSGIQAVGRVTLQPAEGGVPIFLGTKTTGWSLADTELDLITAAILQIGRNDGSNASGSITINGVVTLDPVQVPVLSLFTGAGVADQGGNSGISATSLAIRAGTGSVTLNGTGNKVVNLAGEITGTSGSSFSFTDHDASAADPLVVNTVDSLAGVSTAAGGGNITLTADDLDIDTSATLQAGSGTATLQPLNPSQAINLFRSAGDFDLTYAEYGRITAGTVVIGRSDGNGPVEIGDSGDPVRTLGQNLTVRSPRLGWPTSPLTKTFNVKVALENPPGASYALVLNAGGGVFSMDENITLGSGSATVIAQSISINPAATLQANGGVTLANGYQDGSGNYGDIYLSPLGAVSAPDLNLSSTVLQRVSTTGFLTVGLGESNGTTWIGNVLVGGVLFPFGGLRLVTADTGLVTYEAGGSVLASNSVETIIDGPFQLPGSRTINMAADGGAGANLSILKGLFGSNNDEILTVTMGSTANTFTLAGGNVPPSASRAIGTIDLQGWTGGVVFGSLANQRGLSVGFTRDFVLPAGAQLAWGDIYLYAFEGADLNFPSGNLTRLAGGQDQRLFLQTSGGGNVTTLGINAVAIRIDSSGSVSLGGALLADETVYVEGGVGSTVTAGTITAGTDVEIYGDILDLGGVVTAGGDIAVAPTSPSKLFLVGNVSGADLTLAELLRLQTATGEVRLGRETSTGGIVLAGPLDLNPAGNITRRYAALGSAPGSLEFRGSGTIVTLPDQGALRISFGQGNVVASGGLDLAGNGATLQIGSGGLIGSAGNPLRTAVGTVLGEGAGGAPGVMGSFFLQNQGALTLAGRFQTSASSGVVQIRALSGSMTLAPGFQMRAGSVILGTPGNLVNYAGSNPFAGTGRTLLYSYSQRFNLPYDFSGLNGFGVAFGRAFGADLPAGNWLAYSSYAQVGLNEGVVYYEMFSGNSVSALLALSPELFWSVNSQMIPKTRSGGYIDYMLYPQRVEPATSTLPQPSLSRLEEKLGRPPTVAEIAAEEAERRRNRMLRTGVLMERTSFDVNGQPQAEVNPSIRADRAEFGDEKTHSPQVKIQADTKIPTAQLPLPDETVPQASKPTDRNPEVKSPGLRRGPNRAVVLRSEPLDAKKILAAEREKAEVNLSAPVAGAK